MTIIALEVFEKKLSCLIDCLRQVFPKDDIVSFSDPFFAAQYGTNNKVDMLFTDICMGGINGITVASMIRKNNSNADVFFLADSGLYIDKAEEAIKDCAYIVRPVTAEIILDEIPKLHAARV